MELQRAGPAIALAALQRQASQGRFALGFLRPLASRAGRPAWRGRDRWDPGCPSVRLRSATRACVPRGSAVVVHVRRTRCRPPGHPAAEPQPARLQQHSPGNPCGALGALRVMVKKSSKAVPGRLRAGSLVFSSADFQNLCSLSSSHWPSWAASCVLRLMIPRGGAPLFVSCRAVQPSAELIRGAGWWQAEEG